MSSARAVAVRYLRIVVLEFVGSLMACLFSSFLFSRFLVPPFVALLSYACKTHFLLSLCLGLFITFLSRLTRPVSEWHPRFRIGYEKGPGMTNRGSNNCNRRLESVKPLSFSNIVPNRAFCPGRL